MSFQFSKFRNKFDVKKIFIIIFAIFALYLAYRSILFLDVNGYFAFDLRLRINEICCSHQGINPFHVWSGKIHFPPYHRLDDASVPDAGRKNVHAYPPWHTTFFWFYGWFHPNVTIAFFSVLYGLIIICGLVFFERKTHSADNWRKCLFWSIVLLTVFPVICISYWLNYGLLIAFLYAFFIRLLSQKKDISAGVLWAFMMIKPQIALLFFWPLFFSKKYKTIFVAVAVCILALLLPAWIYKESPIDLLLQIPEIGAPYKEFWKLPFLENYCPFFSSIWMIFCFILCAVFSWIGRKTPSLWVRFFPCLIIFPYWTYSQKHDLIVSWSLYLFLGLVLIDFIRFSKYHKQLKILILTAVIGSKISILARWVMKHFLPVSKPERILLCRYLDIGGEFFFAFVSLLCYVIFVKSNSKWNSEQGKDPQNSFDAADLLSR